MRRSSQSSAVSIAADKTVSLDVESGRSGAVVCGEVDWSSDGKPAGDSNDGATPKNLRPDV